MDAQKAGNRRTTVGSNLRVSTRPMISVCQEGFFIRMTRDPSFRITFGGQSVLDYTDERLSKVFTVVCVAEHESEDCAQSHQDDESNVGTIVDILVLCDIDVLTKRDLPLVRIFRGRRFERKKDLPNYQEQHPC